MSTTADSKISSRGLAEIDLDAISSEEIRRRIEEVESGQAELIDHDLVIKSIRELISARV